MSLNHAAHEVGGVTRTKDVFILWRCVRCEQDAAPHMALALDTKCCWHMGAFGWCACSQGVVKATAEVCPPAAPLDPKLSEEGVRMLLAEPPNAEGHTILIRLVIKKDAVLVAAVCAAPEGAGLLGARDAEDKTPLFHAVGVNWTEGVQLLLAAGAAAHEVADHRQALGAIIGKPEGADTSAWCALVESGQVDLNACDPDCDIREGVTLTSTFITLQRFSAAKKLLAHGADPWRRDAWGVSPFTAGLLLGAWPLFTHFPDMASHLNDADKEGRTAAMFALYHNMDVFGGLADAGVDFNCVLPTGMTLVCQGLQWLAAGKNVAAGMRMLLQQPSLDLSRQEAQGVSVVEYARSLKVYGWAGLIERTQASKTRGTKRGRS